MSPFEEALAMAIKWAETPKRMTSDYGFNPEDIEAKARYTTACASMAGIWLALAEAQRGLERFGG